MRDRPRPPGLAHAQPKSGVADQPLQRRALFVRARSQQPGLPVLDDLAIDPDR